jgi:hypothetical protein
METLARVGMGHNEVTAQILHDGIGLSPQVFDRLLKAVDSRDTIAGLKH